MRYRVKTVAELTGIPRSTLVAWERRYGIPKPERLSNGYRLYSDEDVSVLLRLRDALASGLRVSEAAEMVREGRAPAHLPRSAGLKEAPSFAEARDELLEALLDFDRPKGERLIERIYNLPFLTAIDEVYFPILHRLGYEWERNKVTIAQEHFVSAFIRDQLVAMWLRVGGGRSAGPRVACVTFPGEKHELALLALAIHLSLRGCRVTYLGADLPRSDVCRFLKQTRHDWACVSVIISISSKALLAYARALASEAPPETRIVLGGTGLPLLGGKSVPKRIKLIRDWRDLDVV